MNRKALIMAAAASALAMPSPGYRLGEADQRVAFDATNYTTPKLKSAALKRLLRK